MILGNFWFFHTGFGPREGHFRLNGAIALRKNWIWAHMEPPSRPISAPINQFRCFRRCQGVPEPIFWDALERNHRSGILHRIHYFPAEMVSGAAVQTLPNTRRSLRMTWVHKQTPSNYCTEISCSSLDAKSNRGTENAKTLQRKTNI